jgi:hypothetical protein
MMRSTVPSELTGERWVSWATLHPETPNDVLRCLPEGFKDQQKLPCRKLSL